MTLKIATAVEKSRNSKVGNVSATYVALRSCPDSCALKGRGCYAELGKVGMTVRRLDAQASLWGSDGRDMARAEAKGIDGLSGKRPLRLHVSGDSRTAVNAAIVADAADRYTARYGQPVWSYTHAWRDVPREAWGGVSILASVESLADASRALDEGYAPAVVVAEHPADGKAWRSGEGIKVIPCPAQTRESVTCDACKLCFSADRLHATRSAIAFSAHGGRTAQVKRTLVYQGK
jgi:hypothetical protein